MNDEAFWKSLEALLAQGPIVTDRPKGSSHPRHPNMHYPLDYGYIQRSSAGDGEEIDLWFGSQSKRVLTGILCTYDINKRDAEIKLLLGCTSEDLHAIREFYTDGMRLWFVENPFLRR